jgi:dihydroorotase
MSGVKSLSEAGLVGREAKPADLVLRRATLLDPVAGIEGVHDLVVKEGRIAELTGPGEAEVAEGAEVIEAEGLHAFPAFFDPHVHLRTPGQEQKEDLETGTRSAAAGGYCGLIAMANTSPPVSAPSDVITLRERARTEASVPVGFLATLSQGMAGKQLNEMAALREAGALGFSDDGLPIADAALMRLALQYQRLCGGRIALHEQDPQLARDGVMHEGAVSAELGLAGWPSVAERVMVERDIALAEYEGGQIQLQHISAAESLEAIAAAKRRAAEGRVAEGTSITAEVTPHHLCLTDEEVRSLDATRFKMNPPLREEGDRQALIAALKDGTLDCIATDHAPHIAEDKRVPFERAAFGVTGLEVAFAALHTELVLPGLIGLDLLVEKLGAGGEFFGVPRSSLAPGSEANIALCDLEMEWTAGDEGYESRSSNCWADGRRLRGRPVVTVAAGQVAYRLRSFSLGIAQ